MKNTTFFRAVTGLLAMTGLCQTGRADVQLYPLFANDMVLQRDKPAPVWGTAKPGERVSVQVGRQTQRTTADAAGNWKVTLKAIPATQKISFQVSGENRVELQNVAVGDVYICSGQSNMAMRVSQVINRDAEIAAANYPGLRHFTVPTVIEGQPQRKFGGLTQWQVATPQNAPNFSAVAYFFGRELNQKLGIPIGLIHSSWGGTIAQTWISRETLLKREDTRAETLAIQDAFANVDEAADRAKYEQWMQKVDPGTKENWNTMEFDDTAWKTMKLPVSWEDAGLPNYDGLVWFRKSIEIPAAWAGKDVHLHLGNVDDADTTYFNGAVVGRTDGFGKARDYIIPATQIKAGRATVAVRVLDTGGGGGIYAVDDIYLALKDDSTQKIDLKGDWQYKASSNLESIRPIPLTSSAIRTQPNHPTLLYNAMISPLQPFAVKGAIWYQGESNDSQPIQYRTLFPDLIKDWRQHWNAKTNGSDFPFYFVQLASFRGRTNEPVQSGWAELRDAQSHTLQVVPGTGMASAIDVGEANDIHPRNKQAVGQRLALNALALTYGQKIEYTGPTFKSMKAAGNTIRIEFTHADGLKTVDGAAPRSFALQGQDGKWVTANALIEGNTVILSHETVTAPQAVRYAWADNPDVNLVNSAGLPANPFRTDSP